MSDYSYKANSLGAAGLTASIKVTPTALLHAS